MKNIFYCLLIAFSLTACQAQQKNVKLTEPKEFHENVAGNNIQLIDVRTPKEYKAGHLKNAQNIHLYDNDFEQRIDKLDKNKPVFVYCKVGGRSAEAVEIMQANGFKNITELKGGIDAWQEAGKPVVQ